MVIEGHGTSWKDVIIKRHVWNMWHVADFLKSERKERMGRSSGHRYLKSVSELNQTETGLTLMMIMMIVLILY